MIGCRCRVVQNQINGKRSIRKAAGVAKGEGKCAAPLPLAAIFTFSTRCCLNEAHPAQLIMSLLNQPLQQHMGFSEIALEERIKTGAWRNLIPD